MSDLRTAGRLLAVVTCALAVTLLAAGCGSGPTLSGAVSAMEGNPVSVTVEGEARTDGDSQKWRAKGVLAQPDWELKFEPEGTTPGIAIADEDVFTERSVDGVLYIQEGSDSKWIRADQTGSLPMHQPETGAATTRSAGNSGAGRVVLADVPPPTAAATTRPSDSQDTEEADQYKQIGISFEMTGVPSPAWVLQQLASADKPEQKFEHFTVEADKDDLNKWAQADFEAIVGSAGLPGDVVGSAKPVVEARAARIEADLDGTSLASVEVHVEYAMSDLGLGTLSTESDWTMSFDTEAQASGVAAPSPDEMDATPNESEDALASLGLKIFAPSKLPSGWTFDGSEAIAADDTPEGCDQAHLSYSNDEGSLVDVYEMAPDCFELTAIPPKAKDVKAGDTMAKYWVDEGMATIGWVADGTGIIVEGYAPKNQLEDFVASFAAAPQLSAAGH